MEGQVVATDDPDQMGRVKVWVPALDGETFEIDRLAWAEYASPFAGFTVDYAAGAGTSINASHAAYGFWAVPKVGASVLVFCLNGDQTSRFYFACTTRLHRNRSLPAGRNQHAGKTGPFGDAQDAAGNMIPIQPAYDNLRAQFANKVDSSQARTRGATERQVAQAQTHKDGAEGYSASPADASYLDPQTYCIVTPGRNAIIMQDDPLHARLRLKTAEGHQIIFDDTNERIYISTARGDSWIELDQDGHVHIFGSQSISVRAGMDFNVTADRDINFHAGRAVAIKANTGDVRINTGASVHVQATGSILQTACGNIHISSESATKITAAAGMDIRAEAALKISSNTLDVSGGVAARFSANTIDLNGPQATLAVAATCASPAPSPSVVPGHEPWTRPQSPRPRGKNWKE